MLLAVTMSLLLSASPDDGFSSPPLIVAEPVPAVAQPSAETPPPLVPAPAPQPEPAAAPPLVSADVGLSAPPLVPSASAQVTVTAPVPAASAPPAPPLVAVPMDPPSTGTRPFVIANPPLDDAPATAPVAQQQQAAQPQPAYNQPAYNQPAYNQPAYYGPYNQPGSQPAPTVAATPEPQPKPDDIPAFSMRALGTGSYSLTSGTFNVGARAELDIYRIALNLSYDQPLFSELGTADAQQFTGLIGIAPIANRNLRLRVLGGADVRLTPSSLAVGPSFGVNGRVGISFIALDAQAIITPLPFRRLEARAALVLKAGPVEFQGGYQVRLLDTTTGGTLATMFSSMPEAGPYAALGISL